MSRTLFSNMLSYLLTSGRESCLDSLYPSIKFDRMHFFPSSFLIGPFAQSRLVDYQEIFLRLSFLSHATYPIMVRGSWVPCVSTHCGFQLPYHRSIQRLLSENAPGNSLFHLPQSQCYGFDCRSGGEFLHHMCGFFLWDC